MSEKHLLVNQGLVYCSQSVANNSPATAVPITVTSQQLVTANGGKLVATVDDTSIVNMNFILCKDPKSQVPPPCMANVKWSKMHGGVQIGGKGLLILTEESEAICNVCSVPGKIKVAFHGQQATVVAEAMDEAEPEIMEALNPLAQPYIPASSVENTEIDEITNANIYRVATIDQINSTEIR